MNGCIKSVSYTHLDVYKRQVLLGANNALGAEFLAQVQRRARKYNTGTIIITQQPSAIRRSNIDTRVLLRLNSQHTSHPQHKGG